MSTEIHSFRFLLHFDLVQSSLVLRRELREAQSHDKSSRIFFVIIYIALLIVCGWADHSLCAHSPLCSFTHTQTHSSTHTHTQLGCKSGYKSSENLCFLRCAKRTKCAPLNVNELNTTTESANSARRAKRKKIANCAKNAKRQNKLPCILRYLGRGDSKQPENKINRRTSWTERAAYGRSRSVGRTIRCVCENCERSLKPHHQTMMIYCARTVHNISIICNSIIISSARFGTQTRLKYDLLSAINIHISFPTSETKRKETKRRDNNDEIRNEFVDDGIQSMSATPDSFAC